MTDYWLNPTITDPDLLYWQEKLLQDLRKTLGLLAINHMIEWKEIEKVE